MAVRIRMKKMGRRHRPFFRVCAMDSQTPRDGRVLEELGTYDPMVRDTDGRTILNCERIDYWISVGAQPSDKVGVLIKKYGSSGTHLQQQKAALAQLAERRAVPEREAPVFVPKPEEPAAEAVTEAPAQKAVATESPAPEAATTEAPTKETAEEKPAEEAAAESTKEKPTEEKQAE